MMPTHKAITSGMSRLSAARDVVTVPAKSAIGTAYSNTIRFSVDASFEPKSCRRAATKPSKKVNTIGRSALKIVSSILPARPCRREKFHPLNSFAEPPQGRESVCTAGIIIEWLDDEAHTLGFAQRQVALRPENAMCVDRICNLNHRFLCLLPE